MEPPPEWRDIRAEFACEYGERASFPDGAGAKAARWKDLLEYSEALYETLYTAWVRRVGAEAARGNPKHEGDTKRQTLVEYWATHWRGGQEVDGGGECTSPKRKMMEMDFAQRRLVVDSVLFSTQIFGNSPSMQFMNQAYARFYAEVDKCINPDVLRVYMNYQARVQEALERSRDPYMNKKACTTFVEEFIRPALQRQRTRIEAAYNEAFGLVE